MGLFRESSRAEILTVARIGAQFLTDQHSGRPYGLAVLAAATRLKGLLSSQNRRPNESGGASSVRNRQLHRFIDTIVAGLEWAIATDFTRSWREEARGQPSRGP